MLPTPEMPALQGRPGASRPGAPPPAPAPGKPAAAPEQKQVTKRAEDVAACQAEGEGTGSNQRRHTAGNVVSKERKQGTEKEKQERRKLCFFFFFNHQYFKESKKKNFGLACGSIT